LTAWFFARASRGRMAVGRVTAGILPLAKRGEEQRVEPPMAARTIGYNFCFRSYLTFYLSLFIFSTISSFSLSFSSSSICPSGQIGYCLSMCSSIARLIFSFSLKSFSSSPLSTSSTCGYKAGSMSKCSLETIAARVPRRLLYP